MVEALDNVCLENSSIICVLGTRPRAVLQCFGSQPTVCELKISNKHINFILTKNLKSRVQLNHSQKYQNLCGNSSSLERKSMEQLLPNPL